MFSRLRGAGLATLAAWLLAGAVQAQTAPPIPDGPLLSLKELRAKYQDPAGRYATIDGVEIYYKDEGKGPALLMVHGSQSTLRTWDVIAARLKSHYRIIRYDVPPMGLSGHVSDEVAAKVKPAEIPEKLLEKLGVKKVTAVGVSSGGTMAVFLAARRPDMVERLVVSNTPSDPVVTTHLPPNAVWDQTQKEAAARGGYRDVNYWAQFLTYFAGVPSRISAKTHAEYYDFNRREIERNPIALVARVAQGTDHAVTAQEFAKVTQPTLMIWGGADPLLTPPTADVLAGYLPHAKITKVMLKDVGHYPPLEDPVRFADTLDQWLKTTPGVAGKPRR